MTFTPHRKKVTNLLITTNKNPYFNVSHPVVLIQFIQSIKQSNTTNFYYTHISKATCFDFYKVIIRPFFKRTDPTHYGL